MELREFLSIRRAYNLVRQGRSEGRLTFVELSILCRIKTLGRTMTTSEIAEYQHALRPTMTHRTKHLADLGLLTRSKGSTDKRNVICEITPEGDAYVSEACAAICEILRSGSVLSRTNPVRICRYVDAMGSVSCMSGDLVMLGILDSPEGACTVGSLVETLGLLQPTVSMSVAALEVAGMVERHSIGAHAGRSSHIVLTEAGSEQAQQLLETIRELVVRRRA